MRRYALLVFMLTTGLCPLLFARIGETPEACDQRYGPQLQTGTPTRGFWDAEQRHEKNGVRISIRFLRNAEGVLQAEYLEYKPMDLTDVPLSEDRIQSLLNIISTNWTKLTLIPLPPPPTNTTPDTIRTMVRTSKVKVITLEKKGGIEEQRLKQEAAARKAMLDVIESQNRETTQLKNKIIKLTRNGLTYWQSSQAYAAGNSSSLCVMSAAYMKAYEKHIEDAAAALKGL